MMKINKIIENGTVKMNPNNFGQLIGRIVDVLEPQEKTNRAGGTYTVTTIIVSVMMFGRDCEIPVKIYDYDCLQFLDKNMLVHILCHMRAQKFMNKKQMPVYCPEIIADSVRIIMPNADLESIYAEDCEFCDEYYDADPSEYEEDDEAES